MDLPVDVAARRRVVEHAVDRERRGQPVGRRDVRQLGLARDRHQRDDAEDRDRRARSAPSAAGSARPIIAPGDRAGRGEQRQRQREPQVGETAAQQVGPGGERAGQRDQQAGAAHEVEVEREEAADDRHEQHAAADARGHRDDAQQEADDEQRQRPDPPREFRCAAPAAANAGAATVASSMKAAAESPAECGPCRWIRSRTSIGTSGGARSGVRRSMTPNSAHPRGAPRPASGRIWPPTHQYAIRRPSVNSRMA